MTTLPLRRCVSAPAALPPRAEPLYWSLQKERRVAAAKDAHYLKRVQQHGMTRAWRRKICRWMFQTAKEFELSVDSVGNAVHFLDQFLSRRSVDRAALQLLGMVCMWVATKMHEARPILIAEMQIMCERKFSRQDMLDAEAQLATLIKFQFSPPNAFSFARDMAKLLPFESSRDRGHAINSAFLVLERALEDVAAVGCSASSLALATLQLVGQHEFGLKPDQLSTAAVLGEASDEIAAKDLEQAMALLNSVYFRESAANAEDANVISCSPTAVEELFDYCPSLSEPQENEQANEKELESEEQSLLADEGEELFASDSEVLESPPRPSRRRAREEDEEEQQEDDAKAHIKRQRVV